MSGSQRYKYAWWLVGREVVSASVSLNQYVQRKAAQNKKTRFVVRWKRPPPRERPPGVWPSTLGVAPEVLRRSWRIAP